MHARSGRTVSGAEPSRRFFPAHGARTSTFFSSSPFALAQQQADAAEGDAIEHAPVVQTKLAMGAPGDRFEQEADAMADRVVQRMHAGPPRTDRAPSLQAKCAECREEEKVQRQVAGPGPMTVPGSVQQTLEAGSGGGETMPPALRDQMESAFGSDFSGVRVHTGPSADRLNRDPNARAFTYGTDVYFNSGEYRPDTDAGKHLLAHELTHVVQQSSASPPPVQRQEGVDEAALSQCVAELGGSPGYRDGGLPSAEELARYREECLKRQQSAGPSNSRAIENLRRAWEFAQERLDVEVRNEVANLFSPASLAAMAVFAGLYIASQFTPVGWVADAIALTLLTLTVIFVGALVFQIARDLVTFFSAVNATTEDELRESGYALARALARGGVGILVALLTRGMRGGRPPTPTAGAPATALVEAVGVGRVRVPIRATTVAEAVEASRLQQLASYAVMVPPPGGHSPGSPSSSSSSGGGSGSGTGGERAPGEGGERTPGESGTRAAGGGAAAGFSLTRVPYGGGALSRLAQQFRLALNLRRGGNVAVFEFENIPDGFRRLAARLGGRNVLIEGNRMAVQNVSGAAHSEVLGNELIRAGRQQNMQLNVREIYTEYNPCTDTCLPLIRQSFPNARVTYSFVWEFWGRQTPDRNAAVEALFAAQEQPR